MSCFFDTMITRKNQGGSSSLFDFVPRTSNTLRNFPISLTLDFPQLLDALGKKLKFHINVYQGLKKLFNGLLDLSFHWVTIIIVFSCWICLLQVSYLGYVCCI